MVAVSPLAIGGSGAGGKIRVYNNSSKTIHVTFSGWGCGGVINQISRACASKTISPGGKGEYKYNWGVTTTYITIASNKVGWVTKKEGLLGNVTYNPCVSPSSYQDTDQIEAKEKHCYLNTKKIKTKAYKWSNYSFTG
jgi:hypothetical protein